MRSQWGYAALLPLFSSLVWIGMLMGMLIYWCTSGRPHYPSMGVNQHIAFISDVGAFRLKPLFISASAVMVVTLDLGFVAERWLRHNGRLAPNTRFQRTASLVSIFFAVAGAVGLIILTIFDTYRHHNVHHACLALFIGGYVVSAILVCIEYQRLAIHYREFWILRLSFWIKLVFIIVEVILAIVFASTLSNSGDSRTRQDVSAGVEWTIAFIFTLYALSYVIDLLPSIQSKNHTPQGFISKNAAAMENRLEQGHYRGGDGEEDEKFYTPTGSPPHTAGAAGAADAAAAAAATANANPGLSRPKSRGGVLGWLSRTRKGWPSFSG